MEWLTQLTAGTVVQGSAVVAIVIAAITYVVKFQSTFTDRLEVKGKRDEERIAELVVQAAEAQGSLDDERALRRHEVEEEMGKRRAAESVVARLTFQLEEAGLEPVASITREDPHV